MSFICVCGDGLPQMKLDKCRKYIKNVVSVMPIEVTGNDGVNNFIDLSINPVPESTFLTMFGEQNASKRLHLIRNIKNWTPTTADPVLQTWDDGTTTKLQDGQFSASFIVPETSPLAQYAISAVECANPGVYLIDNSGTIVGYADPDTIATDQKLFPIPVERWQVVTMPTSSATAVANVTVTIFFPINMNLSYWIMLNSDQHELNTWSDYELQGMNIEIGTQPTTTTTVNVVVTTSSDGILGNSQPVSGLGVTAFSIIEGGITPVTVASLVENAPGDYTLTFTALTSGDEITVSLLPASGFVGNSVVELIP